MTAVPFMTDADFDDLEPVMADGWATLAEWYATSIQIVRQGGATVGTFAAVSIKLANRQEYATGAGSPVQDTEQSGLLRLWTSAVTATPVKQGDRFIWNGQACVIATGPVRKRGGISEFTFTLALRNT